MPVASFRSAFLAWLDGSDVTVPLPPERSCKLRKILTHLYTIFFTLIQLLINYHSPFIWHLTYSLLAFHLIFFSILDSFRLVFCNSFLIKCSNNFFTIEISNETCLWYIIFYFFNHKDFLGAISSVVLHKNTFVFWYCCIINNFDIIYWAQLLTQFMHPARNRHVSF